MHESYGSEIGAYRPGTVSHRMTDAHAPILSLAVISLPIYLGDVPDEKEIVWMGTSLDDLRDFPKDARQDAGYQLEQVQLGLDPDDWKPMPDVGSGTREIRVKTEDGVFRVFYVTKFGDEVYVLHSFTKKTQKTEQKDIKLGIKRYSEAKKLYEQKQQEGEVR